MSARAFFEPKLLSECVREFLGRDMSRPLSDQERIKVMMTTVCIFHLLFTWMEKDHRFLYGIF